jgi:hypothetical protein
MADRLGATGRVPSLGRLGDYILGAAMMRLSGEDFQEGECGVHIRAAMGQMARALNGGASIARSADFLRHDDNRAYLLVEDAGFSLTANGTLGLPLNDVTERARAGDSVFLLNQINGKMLIVFAAPESTLENQLCWLFDVPREFGGKFAVADPKTFAIKAIEFPALIVMASLGLVPEPV